MILQEEQLDLFLVPSGLVLMFGYHLLLLYRIIKHPHKTVIGYENHNKKTWVERMMQGDTKNAAVALQVIASNITAATTLSTLSITLSSLIGTWVGNTSNNNFISSIIYGDKRSSTTSIKYITLISSFLLAFASFIQSARYFLHASFLISTPETDIPVKYVQLAVIRGGNFWSLGLRAYYIATTLLMWIFGPIPMFACSVCTVVVLYFLDGNSIPLHHYRSLRSKGSAKRVDEEVPVEATAV